MASIREHMPANCSADVQALIAQIDNVFSGMNTTVIQRIKDPFGFGSLSHLDDVVCIRDPFNHIHDVTATHSSKLFQLGKFYLLAAINKSLTLTPGMADVLNGSTGTPGVCRSTSSLSGLSYPMILSAHNRFGLLPVY